MKNSLRPKKGEDIFVFSWNQFGLESAFSFNEIFNKNDKLEKDAIVGILKSNSSTYVNKITSSEEIIYQTINELRLRAQVNAQRNYEIYTFRVKKSITLKSLIDMFINTPQEIVNLIREKGIKIYGNPLPDNQDIKIR